MDFLPALHRGVAKIQESHKAKQYLRNNSLIISDNFTYSKEMENSLNELSIPTVFIYRDPRAIFLSELNYYQT